MLKGQCFETPAFGVLRRLKSHEAVQVFDELRLQLLNTEVSNQGTEFKIRLPHTEVSNQTTECFKSEPDAWIWVCQDRKIDPMSMLLLDKLGRGSDIADA